MISVKHGPCVDGCWQQIVGIVVGGDDVLVTVVGSQ